MISKKHRLNKDLFNKVFKEGSVVNSPIFLFKFIKNPEKQGVFSFVTPKSVAKTAVKRNSLRRKGYNCLREVKKPSILGVFIYKKGSIDVKKQEVRENIDLIFSKIK